MEAVAAALNNEYEKAKLTLKGVDETITKLYGRDPTEKRPRRVFRPGGNDGAFGGAATNRLFGEARRIINNPNREPIGGPVGLDRGRHPARRTSLGEGPRLGGIQSRLGPKRKRVDSDEDEPLPNKPVVQSAVYVPPVEAPKREDSIAMKTDKKGMARNRRMFGALLGTLQSFQKSSKKDEDREKRRAEVEKKLEAKQKDEQFKLRREKAALWNERREKQRLLRQLEAKMKLVRSFEEWENLIRDQANFIRTTKGKHHIYYMPKKMLPANEKALEDTEDYIEALVKARRKKLEEEIERVMSAPASRRTRTSEERENVGDDDKETSDKSDDSGSEHSDSELEEGEVSMEKRPHLEQEAEAVPKATRPIKVEREEHLMEVKEEAVEGKVGEGEPVPQVSQGVEDEVAVSDDELAVSTTSQHLQAQKVDTEQMEQEVPRSGKSAKVSPSTRRKPTRCSRSVSSASRSRSRSAERQKRPSRSKPKSGKKAGSESSYSSDRSVSGSESGSGSGSASSSGSDSEPEGQGKSDSVGK